MDDERVFRALADATRRLLLDRLDERDGQSLRELCAGLSMARQSVTKHLAVLESANLVTTQRRGRDRLHHLNPGPINAIADGWIDRYSRHRPQAELPSALHSTMDGAPGPGEFVYTTYIRTTPERLWHAVTTPAISDSALGHAIESDWSKGSPYVWVEGGVRTENPGQLIQESDPYQRLAFTYPSTDTATADQGRSRVAFDIDPLDDQVGLTVTHHGLRPGSAMYQQISRSWPLKLANLKSELELAAPPLGS